MTPQEFHAMSYELDKFKENNSISRAEHLWLESKGAGKLEKRMEFDVEIEKFVVSPTFFEYAQKLKQWYNYRSKIEYAKEMANKDYENM